MSRLVIGKNLVCALTVVVAGLLATTMVADDTNPASNPYMPPAKYSPIQLKSHLERMQKVALASRQPGFGEAMVAASDRILESNPSESLRSFAVINLLDGLHQWADVEKNADADKRLAELAAKYKNDNDKRVVLAAKFYDLEQRVLKPENVAPADVPKLLDEVKTALTGRLLNARYLRIATGTQTLINYLSTDEEAEQRFKEFGRLFAASNDPAMIHLGNQFKTEKREPIAGHSGEMPTGENMAQAPRINETAEQWLARVESQLTTSLAGSAHDADYQREKDAFFKQYPHDPQRWRWNFMDARRAMSDPQTRAEGSKMAEGALAEVLAAKDAPPELREQAIVMNMKLEIYTHTPMAELAKTLSDQTKTFPKSTANALAESLVLIITNGQSEEQAIARLTELKSASDGPLAAAAAERIAVLENLLYLKTNPLDLKFVAADGHPFNLEAYRGKVVLIDFWATWCGPCVEGLPEVIQQYKKYHDQGFEIVGISFDQDKQALAQFVKEKDMGWVQFFDGKVWQNTYGTKYGIHAIPCMWLVGPNGHVIDYNARTGLAEKIARLMQHGQPATKSTASTAKLPNKS